MKKIISVILCIVMLLSLCLFTSTAVPEYGRIWDGTTAPITKGSGKAADPYLIETPEQFAGLRLEQQNTVKKHYKLTTDLYMNDISDFDLWNNPGYDTSQLNCWEDHLYLDDEAVFDGDGHIIYGLFATDYRVGAFYLYNATVKNVGLINCKSSFANGLCTRGFDEEIYGLIENCFMVDCLSEFSFNQVTMTSRIVNFYSNTSKFLINELGAN